jgi:hypothetical protein
MGGFFYFFIILMILGFSECSNKLLEFIQVVSYFIYIDCQLPDFLEIFYIALGYFQKNIFPSFGETYF